MKSSIPLKYFWRGLIGASAILLVACSQNAETIPDGSTLASTNGSNAEVADGRSVPSDTELATVSTQSQPTETLHLINPSARNFNDLSGEWQYVPDPFREGLRERVIPQYAMFKDEDDADSPPHALKEYDFGAAPNLTVPGSWTAQVPELSWFEGLVWLRRRFDAAPQDGQRYFLHFGAVNYEAHVFLNGEKIGSHSGGFTPFVFDITGKLKAGENSLVVGVDSEHGEMSIPPERTDWWNYGGITRRVRLIESAPTVINDYWVRLGDGDTIAVDLTLDGPAIGGQTVQVSIPELGIDETVTTSAEGAASLSIDPGNDIEKWSPENPKLYDVNLTLGDDNLSDRIGFRTIEVVGDDILLNGKSIFLRGISMHEEKLGEVADRYLGVDGAQALLSEIKDGLNGNFVRLAHYPHAEETLKVADEMGLLVWSEVPVYWDVAFDNMDVLRNARTMLRDNILRDRNRASIIIWSVANETPIRADRNAFLTTMIRDVRELDPTRLVSQASNQSRHKQGAVVIDDPLADLVDVLSVNYYGGWYGGQRLDTIPDVNWERVSEKPMILSEFGAGAYIEFSDPDTTRKFSIEYQQDLYEVTIEMAKDIPFLRGTSPWVLKDFKSPRRFHAAHQEFWNRKGLLSETGERKPAFATLRTWYDEIEAEYDREQQE